MIFRLLRPDSLSVWKDPVVLTRFNRYKSIIDGEKLARYLIAKKTPINIELHDLALDEAWDSHEKARISFNKFLMQIDEGKTNFDTLPVPSPSFFDLKVWLAKNVLKHCEFCERKCGADRTAGETGICGIGDTAAVSSAFLHRGEEGPLVPSGTIFFAGCTFKCVFCQNFSISQTWDRSREWRNLGPQGIGEVMKSLSDNGALNINWVGGDPTPNIKFILDALMISDINITQLWNSNFYMSEIAMELLVDIMDFWLPDFKYWNNDTAKLYSKISNYQEITTRNLKTCFDKGSGEMIVRHLVMPGQVESETYPILEWCAKEIPLAFVNIMAQYRPQFMVNRTSFPEINEGVGWDEMQMAFAKAQELGIEYKQVS
ncbi:MAG: radical SAM protein [Candidatus Kariarchaeaceae archaeon]|jgi:putative pyruvate formate lyase activating enzyme